MRRLALKILPVAVMVSSVVYGQSLGDVARENREKLKAKAASSTAKPKVITNESLPKNPDTDAGPRERRRERRKDDGGVSQNSFGWPVSGTMEEPDSGAEKCDCKSAGADRQTQRFHSFRRRQRIFQRRTVQPASGEKAGKCSANAAATRRA